MIKRKKQAKRLRWYRKIHRTMGASLFLFFFIVSITSVLLGWKKNSNGIIQSKTVQGVSTDLHNWMPIDSLQAIAFQTLKSDVDPLMSTQLQRIDVRPEKGVAKFIFEENYQEIHLDGTTGEVLLVSTRTADIIENIHDGSILDVWFNTGNDVFKVIFSSVMGVALFLFTFTGFWLWFGPKRMRKQARIIKD